MRSSWLLLTLVCFEFCTSVLFAQESPRLDRTQEIGGIVVNNGNQVALAQLMLGTIALENKQTKQEKAYFELKSFLGSQQIELIEAYFILDQEAFGPKSAVLKTGRFALYPEENRYFTSHAAANALLQFRLNEPGELFPNSPFNVGRHPQKYFRFYLADSVQGSSLDTLLEIRFIPKKADGTAFSGTAWINPQKNELVQLSLFCKDCRQQPFSPLFEVDQIKSIDFQLQCAFEPKGEGATLRHLKANYDLTYLSQHKDQDSSLIHYRSQASIRCYPSSTNTQPPHFYFPEGVAVLRQIMAFPYLNDFWINNIEPFPSANEALRNQQFFETATLNKQLLATHVIRPNRLVEHPYMAWSESRVLLREDIPIAQAQIQTNSFDISALYHIEVQLFYDLLQTKDSTFLLTSCVIDPYQTFYKLLVDAQVNCMLNMYFDLCEIARRAFDAKCRKEPLDQAHIEEHYKEAQQNLDAVLTDFLTQVDRGQNRKAMLKWSAYIASELGIDNVALFALYP